MLQAQIWEALAKFPSRGSKAACTSLLALKEHWDGPGARSMIDEQMFGVYAIDGCWSLALASSKFDEQGAASCHRVSSALRMRAYLEQGDWSAAQQLLRAACETPTPTPFSLRVQWVFLAMGGHAKVESLADNPAVQAALGMSPASAQLWLALYYRAKGERETCERALDDSLHEYGVQMVFHRRMVEVVRESLSKSEPVLAWPSDLLGERRDAFEDFERARVKAPRLAGSRGAVMALLMICGLLARYIVVARHDGLVDALLDWGALTPEIWANRGWWRAFTAPFLVADLFGWLLVSYLWWLSCGQGVQRFGALRWVLALLVAPGLCLTMMGALAPGHAGAAANSLALVAAMTTVLWSGFSSFAPAGRSKSVGWVIGALLLVKLIGAASVPGAGLAAAMSMLSCVALCSLVLGPWRVDDANRRAPVAWVILGGWCLLWPLIRVDPGPQALLDAAPRKCSAMGLDWELPSRFHAPNTGFSRTALFPDLQGWVDGGAWQGRTRVQLGVVKRKESLSSEQASVLAAWPKLAQRFQTARPGIALVPELAVDSPGLRVLELRQEGQGLALLAERDLRLSDGTMGTVAMLWQPRRPSVNYSPTQLQAFFSARASQGQLPPCPGGPASP